jgi:RimJ/RimL family protein N-acetyltransferase
MVYSEQSKVTHTRLSAEEYLLSFNFVDNFLLSIKFDNELVGTASIYISSDSGSIIANMGLLIGKEYASQGFGLEAWTVLKDYFGNIYSPITIMAGTRIENIGMNFICQKSGMEKLNPHPSFKLDEFNFRLFNYYSQVY